MVKCLCKILCSIILFSQPIFAKIITYPHIPSLTTSDVYSIKVNGQDIWTEKIRTNFELEKLPDWFTGSPYVNEQQEVHFCHFSSDEAMTINININGKIDSARVRPKSYKIPVEINGAEFSFKINGPEKLYINVNNLPPLIFAVNPVEINVPDKDDKNIKYFGPGVHRPGYIELQSNETIYIAGGAIVYGGIRAKNVENIKVIGRGILDGNLEFRRMVRIEDSKSILFDGITIRSGNGWTNTLVHCKDVEYRNVKVISFGPGGDGINPLNSENFLIQNCFLRCTDDCIAIKAPDTTQIVKNIRVLDNTMVGFAYSDGVTVGFETNGPTVSDILVRNCDVLQARGGSRVDGHSAFSIICDGPAKISNVRFEDIRVEEDVLKAFELNITNGTLYGDNPPGHMRDIYLKNINWLSNRPFYINGFNKDHIVENVIFENCFMNGKKLTQKSVDTFIINDFVKDIFVK